MGVCWGSRRHPAEPALERSHIAASRATVGTESALLLGPRWSYLRAYTAGIELWGTVSVLFCLPLVLAV